MTLNQIRYGMLALAGLYSNMKKFKSKGSHEPQQINIQKCINAIAKQCTFQVYTYHIYSHYLLQ